jgi:O-antigen/teichoic acid export membrane protein
MSFIQIVVAARVLDPEVVGLVAVFYIIQGVVEAYTVTGLGKAIIQRSDIGQEHLDTTFVSHSCRGVFLALLVFFGAPYIVSWMGVTDAKSVIQAMSIVMVLQGLRNPGVLMFLRNLTFRQQFIWSATGSLVRFVSTLTLLYLLENEWALVFGVILQEFVLLVLSYTLSNIRPNFRWNRSAFFALFSYGKWVLLSAVIATIDRQGNQIAAVNLLGEEALGILFVTLQISRAPVTFTQQLKNVLFPVFSRLQESSQKVKSLYEKSSAIVAFIGFPLAGCVIYFSVTFTQLFFKPAWVGIAGILGIIVCANTIESLNGLTISLFNSQGHPKIAFYNNLVRAVVIVITIVPLVMILDIKGIAVAYLLKAFAAFLYCSLALRRVMGRDMNIIHNYIFPIFGTGLVLVLFYTANILFLIEIETLRMFTTSVILYFFLYIALAFLYEYVFEGCNLYMIGIRKIPVYIKEKWRN